MSGPRVNPFAAFVEHDEGDEANMEVEFNEEDFTPLDFNEPVYDPYEENWELHENESETL